MKKFVPLELDKSNGKKKKEMENLILLTWKQWDWFIQKMKAVGLDGHSGTYKRHYGV